MGTGPMGPVVWEGWWPEENMGHKVSSVPPEKGLPTLWGATKSGVWL